MASVGCGARVLVHMMFTHDHYSLNSQTLAVANGRDEVESNMIRSAEVGREEIEKELDEEMLEGAEKTKFRRAWSHNDTLREVRHPSNEGVALQARV